MENNLINLKDVSKPIVALIDALKRGVGVLYEPTRIRRLAKAKADEILILAGAELKKNEIFSAVQNRVGQAIPSDQLTEIVSRIVSKEVKRQENIDEIVQVALIDLEKKKDIPEAKPDTDWLTRFFDIAESVSDDELRNTWGKILSQEIQSPGSCSLRTLSTISNLSKKEAELFSSLGNYIFDSCDRKFLLNSDDDILGVDIHYGDITLLMECGLIKENGDISFSYSSDKSNIEKFAFIYQDLAIIIELGVGIDKLEIPIYELTTAGAEIYRIMNMEKDMTLLEKAANILRSPNIRFGYTMFNYIKDGIVNIDDDKITYL